MLINLSNHPLASWSEKQKQAAEQQFGQIIDLSFPSVPTEADLAQVMQLVGEYVQKCNDIINKSAETDSMKPSKDAIHVMGEMTFVYQFVQKMSELGVLCVASTTRRIAIDNPDGSKLSNFEFVRFRPYTMELF